MDLDGLWITGETPPNPGPSGLAAMQHYCLFSRF